MAKILVVEDDVNMNEILVSTLELEEHQMDSAFNGPAAIELVKDNDYDLVITDVRLPGIDGVQTIEGIRKIRPRIKCIIITGYASADTPIRAIRQQIDDYLFKPFSLNYLMDSVERVLSSPAEKKSRRSLFQRVFSKLGSSKDKELEKLVLGRHAAFQGLYVGIRSKYLNLKAACEVYIRLELSEKRFRALLNTPEPGSRDIVFLQEQYTDIHQRIGEFKQGEATEAPNEGVIPPQKFKTLFEAVLNSEIGVEELQYAPLLREAPEERFETIKELAEIKQRLWPED